MQRRKLVLRNTGDFVILSAGRPINIGDYLEAIVIEPTHVVQISVSNVRIGIRVTCSAIGEIVYGLDFIVSALTIRAHLDTLMQGDEIILRSMQHYGQGGQMWSWPRLPMLKKSLETS